jgi:hypothetical protein
MRPFGYTQVSMRRTYVNVNDLNLHNGLLDVKVQKGEPGLSVVQQSYFLPEMASPESAVSREAERDVGCRILYMGRMSKAPIGQAFKAAFSEKEALLQTPWLSFVLRHRCFGPNERS